MSRAAVLAHSSGVEGEIPEPAISRIPSRTAALRLDLSSKTWDAQALSALFSSTFTGDEIIVVSNREPYAHERVNGRVRITQPASGMVTAVEPIVRACAGTWIAHGGGDADREPVDQGDVWQVPPAASGFRLRRVWLDLEEQRGYYDGFSNSGLWPVCHRVPVRPSFSEQDWEHYRTANARFADAVISEARRPDPIVLVQDYHLALVPTMVRSRLPRATIVSFWHIPWAHPDQMEICPWLPELVEGLRGSDIAGFQTPSHRRNFAESAERCGLSVADDRREIVWRGDTTRVRDYPISVAWPTAAETNALPAVECCRRDAASRWSLGLDGKLIVGVDRFDYTKGLIERLRAVEHLLASLPQWQGRVRFVQVAAPTRTALAEYASLRARVFAEVQRINARFASDGPEPISLLDEHHDRAAVNALYRAADLCLVTSLDDGMNLVCKEFIASRDDEQGVLVLSRFTGAAQELPAALIVNPYHTEQVANALHRGLSMPAEEQRLRMRSLRETVKCRNVYRWAANILLDAAALRNQRATRGLGAIAGIMASA